MEQKKRFVIDEYSDGSHVKVIVECDFNISDKCRNEYTGEYRYIRKNYIRNGGKYICLYCSRFLKHSDCKNPNARYKIDDSMFKKVDTDFKAYFLGIVASDGHIRKRDITIELNNRDIEILKKLRDGICENLTLKELNNNMISLTIVSTQMSKDIINHLGIEYDKKDSKTSIPEFSEDLKWSFIRGYFDGNGCITIRKTRVPLCSISTDSHIMLESLKEFCGLPSSLSKNQIEWNGVAALDFLGKIYMGSPIYMKRKYDKFLSVISWDPTQYPMFPVTKPLPIFKYTKTCDDARPPEKSRISDTGYDLHLIKKIKEVNGVHYFDTCIRVQPEYGYYFDLVGRSSISKTGWTLANNIGIIDMSYRGSIIVALVPFIDKPKDLELPCKLVQLIPRKVIIMDEPEEVIDIEKTDRNDSGGLGSNQFIEDTVRGY